MRLAKQLERYGGDERIMERERQLESYLTQSGLTDEQRHAALRDLRAAHTQRAARNVSVYGGSDRIFARIQSYNRMAGGRWEPKNAEDRRQLDQVKKDFALTKEEFSVAATDKAWDVLRSSAQVIFGALEQFGITDATPVQSAIIGVHIGGKSAESQAGVWLDTARQAYRDTYERRDAVTVRAQYAKNVDRLIGLQKGVREAEINESMAREKVRRERQRTGEGGADWVMQDMVEQMLDLVPGNRRKQPRPKDAGHAAAWDKVQSAREALALAWHATEQSNPALAAYRARGGELSDIDLGKKGMSGDQRLKHTLGPIVEKFVNIHEAMSALKEGKLKPMSLKPVVRQVRADLLIPVGSTFDPAVKSAIAEAGEPSWAIKIMDAVMFALSFTGLGGIASSAYDMLKEYVKYTSDKRLTNTALDATQSISDEDPSLTGLILAAVDLGMSIHEVRQVFTEARKLKTTMLEGGEEASNAARKQLDELGERHGIDDLAGDVERRSGKAAEPKPTPQLTPAPTPTPTAAPVPKKKKKTVKPERSQRPSNFSGSPDEIPAKPARRRSSFDKGKGARPAYHKDPVTGIPSGTGNLADAALAKERTEFRTGLRASLTSPAGQNPTWRRVEDLLKDPRITRTADLDEVVDEARKLNRTAQDPDALLRGADELWAQVRATGKTPEKVLVDHFGGKLPVLRDVDGGIDEGIAAFWEQAVKDKPFIDAPFVGEDHGAFVHIFQQYVVDLRHGPGTSQRFRQKLAKLTQPLPGSSSRRVRDLVWDGVFDETETAFLNSPERLGPILAQHLGVERVRRAKKAKQQP